MNSPIQGWGREKILQAMQEGELKLEGQFVIGSNYTLLAKLHFRSQDFKVVYKPERGERPLWDFSFGSLEKREVAAFLVSEMLGWELVPPTVYRQDGPLGPGSVQLFIDHDPNYFYFNFSDQDVQQLRPVVVFDILINNADRKGGHILKDPLGHLWLIDHGVCFHETDKLRTIIWDFAGEKIPDNLLQEVSDFRNKLEEDAEIDQRLSEWLSKYEIKAISSRASRLLKQRVFPYPDERVRSYPWPPV
jgi:uncharacterized repeat protein (TIGR03843 family)